MELVEHIKIRMYESQRRNKPWFMKENNVDSENLSNQYHQYLEEMQRDSLIIHYYKTQLSCFASSVASANVFHKIQRWRIWLILYLM